MDQVLLKYNRPVPRYTSYPTANHFDASVDERRFAGWLAGLDSAEPVSLYLHVPFCKQLCWYCGCHTHIRTRPGGIERFTGQLEAEITHTASVLPGRLPVQHIHWGGGTPSILSPEAFVALNRLLASLFDLSVLREHAIELDPRTVDAPVIDMLVATGVNRVSLGVQDFDPEVQQAINRIQPYEQTAKVVRMVREAGIDSLNLDLLYGLPRQTPAGMRRNIEQLLSLTPDRVALFGYAHVPWFKKHQRLLEAEGLPDVQSRFALMMEARSLLREAGYVEIGLDHYARPDDSLALAFREGRLRRNFQGYTTDRADTLIGFGPSSISSLPQGFAKHHDDLKAWHARVQAGRLATQKGLALTTDDRVRRALIEDLMCRHACDLGQVRRDFALPEGYFDGALAALGPLETDHVVIRTGDRLRINPQYDLLSRIVASCFDSRLQAQQKRHAQAI